MWISNKHIAAILCFVLFAVGVQSQPIEREYGYYIFPIKPGVRNTLAGTMGELRSSHFHTGIDIRTGGRQGLAVLAAADGHISRIKVAGGGYGYSLYILHPNGKTTVYAHLKQFSADIERYVKDQQYAKRSFEVNLFPDENEFRVEQGDTIAYSGNTGSSGGPHLHFDIRDENQDLLNPLTYGFDEVIDTRAPFAKSLALVPFDIDSRVEGDFARVEFKFTNQNGTFILTDTIEAIGEIGLELNAWDRMNGTRFKTGINKIDVYINNEQVFGQNIVSWPFSKARSFYQHINYASLVNTGQRYHKLYQDIGNQLPFYYDSRNRGKIAVQPDKYYHGRILMTDSYGNQSEAKFVIQGIIPETIPDLKPYQIRVLNNIMEIAGDSTTGEDAVFYLDSHKQTLKYQYRTAHGSPVFLWDLREVLPDQVEFSDTTLNTNLVSLVPSNQEYKIFHEHADILFNRGSLFDTLAFKLDFVNDSTLAHGIISIGDPTIPLKGSVKVIYKPEHPVLDQQHSALYQLFGKDNFSFAGGNWVEGHLETRIRSFGDYTILTDSLPPVIKPLIVNHERVIFTITDELSGIKEIRATLNGEWILIAGDPKKQQYWAENRNLEDSFKGSFVMEVIDNTNNSKIYKTTIR